MTKPSSPRMIFRKPLDRPIMQYRTHKRYAAQGICIYCGATASPPSRLSDEHIIARSLGGIAILPEASCECCAKITSQIEGYCANNIFNTLRVQRRLPTRRPKKRRSVLPTVFDIGGHFYGHMVTPRESISSFLCMSFYRPAYYDGIFLAIPTNICMVVLCRQ
jgi:hypothetical protein